MKKLFLVLALSIPAFALDFTITTPTAGWPNAITPSQAVTLTVTGGTPVTNVVCVLSDGGASGTFYPASPATITAPGTTIQFVYTPASAGSASITLQAVCTGGLTDTHTITQSQVAPSTVSSDGFSGTLNTALTAHSPTVGSAWTNIVDVGNPTILSLTGSSAIYITGGGTDSAQAINAAAPISPTEYDETADAKYLDTSNIIYPLLMVQANSGISGDVNGYWLNGENDNNHWSFFRYVNNTATTLFTGVAGPGSGIGTYSTRIAVRQLNGHQILWCFVNGTLLNAPSQDDTFTNGIYMVGLESASITPTVSQGSQLANFATYNADWGSTPALVTFPSANAYQSPYVWRNTSGAAILPTGGGYLYATVTGTTTLGLNVDASLNAALTAANDMPSVKFHIDPTGAQAGVWQEAQWAYSFAPSQPVSLVTGLSTGTTYNVTMYFPGGNQGESGANGWTGTDFQTKVNSIQADNGATFSTPSNRSKTCVFWGNSYELPYFGQPQTGPYYGFVDPTQPWEFMVGYALQCEYGEIGIGSQGWVNAGNGGYPQFSSSWNGYDSTHAKTFSSPQAPNYVVVHQNINSHGSSAASITSTVSSWITSARTAFGPTTKIFIIGDIRNVNASSGTVQAAVQAGITAAADPATWYIPMNQQYSNVVFAPSDSCSLNPTWLSLDDCHPTAVYNGLFTAAIVQGVTQALASGAAPITAQ